MSNSASFARSMKRAKRSRASSPPHSKRPMKRTTLAAAVGAPVRRSRAEWKYLDTYLAATSLTAATGWAGCEVDPINVGATTNVHTLSAPFQGSGPSNRDGSEIMARSIAVDGTVIQSAVLQTQASARYVFVALVLDTRSNGVQLSSEDVYINPSADASCTTSPLRNLVQGRRFRILAVKRVQLVAQFSDGTNAHYNKAHFRFYRKLGIPFNYKANDGKIGDCADNSLHVIAVANSVSGSAPLIQYNARFRFTG